MTNRLAGETSPYLLQHADNPVEWHPWGEEALTLARAQDKPILLSIGYSACHWCHVMAHESFEDAEVAAVMNRLFINIKVDREERPDLDQIYQTAHQMLAGRPGGWPLTLFLTPDGTPFHGGTYFPKEPRHGLPGFTAVCERVAEVWRTRRNDVEARNRDLLDALASQAPKPGGAAVFDAAPVAATRDMLLGGFDRDFGGFGGAPKFPHPTDLAFLLRQKVGAGDTAAGAAALFTLERMAEGGIYDQIGGGFCRYSTDERWEIPHFEKMLYDNGPLLGLHADAWVLTADPLYRRVAEETVGWLLREMTSPEGAFHSSLDADSEGAEGRFYVWDRAEVERLLSPEESALAARRWGLDGPPNFENRHWHLRVVVPMGGAAPAPTADEAVLLESARAKLFAAREKRIRPGRDDKLLTSWNALTIEGLTHAARIFDRADWLLSARRALGFIQATLWRDGRLLATAKDGRAHLNAYLDDYAYLLSALLELLQADYRADDLAFATQLADALLERFEDREAGGFFFTSHDHETLIQRPKSGFDSATPSGNGVAAVVLQRLGHLLGEVRYLEAARRTLECFWPQMRRQAGGFSTLLVALEEALTPPTIIILRGPAAEVSDWQRRLAGRADALVLALPNGTAGLHSALAKPENPHVNAWVCRGVTCLKPTAEFDELLGHLQPT
ncbi:MAG: thioredoxin domain-containing protein [Sulfurisoma sp.]|nr:thioredoxin domain-containing protein [Sulfurisoma sp.]